VRRSRTFFIICSAAVSALLILVVVAAIYVLNPPLPKPAEADREEIVRWLVTRDLGRESSETRQILARRLEEEFGSGVDWESTKTQLSESQRNQLWENVVLLLEPWLLDKTQHYSQLPATERTAFLDELLDTVAIWRNIETLCGQTKDPGVATHTQSSGQDVPSNAAGRQQSLIERFFSQAEKCKAEAQPEDRQKIDEFLVAVQGRWLVRSLKQW